jgi:hypothetical protein
MYLSSGGTSVYAPPVPKARAPAKDTANPAVPAGAAEPEDEQDDEEAGELAAVVERYVEKGPLAADNLIDSILGDQATQERASGGRNVSQRGLMAMRYIIGVALDPAGSPACPWDPSPNRDREKQGRGAAGGSELQEAVCRWASFLALAAYPMQAREAARELLRIHRFNSGLKLPRAWLDAAKVAVDSPTAQTAHPTAAPGKGSKPV